MEMSVRHNIGLPGLGRHKIAGAFLNRGREKLDSALMVQRNEYPDAQRSSTGSIFVGWQSAKSRHRKMALDGAAGAADGRTDSRGRYWGQTGDLSLDGRHWPSRASRSCSCPAKWKKCLSMSDRVLVMHEGRIAGELQRDELSEQAIMQLATGRQTSRLRNLTK